MGAVATREKSPRNGAATQYLRTLKAPQIGLTYEDIAERSGVPLDTVKRLMTNRADFTVDTFLALANALGATDEEAFTALAEISRDH
jgi:transcriptional regulator with XRE-family HTH domain